LEMERLDGEGLEREILEKEVVKDYYYLFYL
jgi:hypothetical protein